MMSIDFKEDLTFSAYEKTALSTAKPSACNLPYLTLGLCGEAGEFAEKVKKLIRDDTWDADLAAKELGDVLWYLALLSNQLGYSLESVARANNEKLLGRKLRNKISGSGDER